ncbi:hypothetical protein WQO_00110 [Streptomyces globisporus C-1027]|uniref:Uncharacterized protein n=1 Tax=Streptomyces globisporus C-1027 TaxID=1172567 RepID=A0A0U3LTP7_STRGL|nr:hypothetical protein WQO_00110 [Streptomyces globisporus C-1027]
MGLVTPDLARKGPEDRQHAVTAERVMLPPTKVTVVGADDPLADLLPRMQPGVEHPLERKGLFGTVSASYVSRTVTWLTTSIPRGHGGGRDT